MSPVRSNWVFISEKIPFFIVTAVKTSTLPQASSQLEGLQKPQQTGLIYCPWQISFTAQN
jgi:hypothetical protein